MSVDVDTTVLDMWKALSDRDWDAVYDRYAPLVPWVIE